MASNSQTAFPTTNSQARQGPRVSDPEQDVVTFLVGPEEVRFVVHENLLVHYSPYFRAALRGGFKEAEEKLIRFLDEAPETFEIFIHWVYHQRLPDKTFMQGNAKFDGWFDEEVMTMEGCILLYIFADKYDVDKLKLDCINELFHFTSSDSKSLLGPESSITLAFATLPSKNPLCRMITDIFCEWANVTKEGHLWSEYTSIPFLQSLWKRFHEKNIKTSHKIGKRVTKEQYTFARDLCYYHDHSNDEEKEACKAHRQSKN